MKCISLWQPYCSLLFVEDPALRKVHETRHWRVPASLLGQRVAFHAAKRQMTRDERADAYEDAARLGLDLPAELPHGALLGTAVLAGCYRTDDCSPFTRVDGAFGDWSFGRFAWRLADPVALPAPLPMRGRQGWWTIEDELGPAP